MTLRFLGLMLLSLSFSVQPFELSGSIGKGVLTWSSAKEEGDKIKLHSWGVASRLPAASKVTLGGVDSVSEKTLILNSGTGKVKVKLSIKGMAYQLSDYSASTNNASGKLVKIIGTGVGKATFTLSSLSSPITHYQPIIKSVHSSGWVKAFEKANAVKGTYLGSLPYAFSYLYERGGITIKHTVSAQLAVRVVYDPATISSVSITGSNIITPVYYGYPERKVRGTTDYNITVSGYFPSGIKMGLDRKNSYQLVASASDSPKKHQDLINYSVKCKSGCKGGEKNIITNGKADIDNNLRRLNVSNSTNTNASVVIEVSFDDKKLSELEGGTYSGSFTLTFKAGL